MRKAYLAASALLAGGLVVAAYAGSLGNALHFDDTHVVENNIFVRDLSNLPRFFTDARTGSSLPANSAYRPLVTTSLAIDARLGGGPKPRAFRTSQLLQLLFLLVLLALFFRRVFDLARRDRGNAFLGLLAATFFAVHVATTETMNLMHARSEIQSTIGLVAGLLLWMRSRRLRRSGIWLLPFVLGTLAKPHAVLFAPLLAVLVFLAVRASAPGRPAGRQRIVRAARASAPAFVVGAAAFAFVEAMAAPGQTYAGPDRLAYALTQPWVWLHYARLFVLPAGLTADSDLELVTAFWDTRLFAGVAFLVLGAAATVAAARSRRSFPIAFGLAWFAIGLLPTSSVLPLAEPMNEHRIFLPYVGLVLAAAWTARLALGRRLDAVPDRRVLAFAGAGVALLSIHAAGTSVRNEAWRTGESLWADVARKSPRNGRGLMNHGLALMRKGDFEGARSRFEAAQRLLPDYPVLAVNLGILAGATGRPADAEVSFRRALALAPGDPSSYTYFARWLVDSGRAAEALPLLATARGLSPAEETSRRLQMALLLASGAREDAAAVARELLAALPADAEARLVAGGRLPASAVPGGAAPFDQGLLLGSQGRFLESALAYQAALERDPGSADTLNNLGWTLGRLGLSGPARRYLGRALDARPGWDRAQNNLAALPPQER